MSYVHIERVDPWKSEKRRIFYKNILWGIIGVFIIALVAVLLYYVTVDKEAPAIDLFSPGKEEVFHQKNILLSYNVSEETKSCTKYVDEKSTDASEPTFSAGKHTWKVSCTDLAGNKGESQENSFWVLTPLRLTRISNAYAPELEEGVLVLYEDPGKETLGEEVYNILPRDVGETQTADLNEGILGIGVWGRSHLDKQEITLYSGEQQYTIYLPEQEGLTGAHMLYVSEDGSTFHSYSSHNYNTSSNSGQELPDLSVEEALVLSHAARLSE